MTNYETRTLTPRHKKHISGVLLLSLFISFLPTASFAALPAGFEIETLASNLVLPTVIAPTPDGRIFIAEKGGAVKIYKNGVILPTPLITLSDVNTYGDRGLIGMTIDPNFSTNNYVYLAYTYENTPGSNLSGMKTGRLVRITAIGDTADESSKVVLMGKVDGNMVTPSCDNYAVTSDCIPSDSPSHSVGGLRFGPDGKLYMTTGDGAHFDYVDARSMRAQNLDSLGGKVLRINSDGTGPADNPFYNGNPNANRSKVFAYGLRNAFRFNFHPTTGRLYAGDVGWNSWEEVNDIRAGGNYGWPCYEGVGLTPGQNCTLPSHVDPLYAYPHDATTGAGAVVAGAFMSGGAYPSQFANSFFFGDFAQNWIKRMDLSATGSVLSVTDVAGGADGADGPVEFVTGMDGNIYFLSIYTGTLKRLLYTTLNRQPIARITSSAISGALPLTVNFSSALSSDPDGDALTYAWNFGDGSSSVAANPTHVYSTRGEYAASLTVRDGRGGQSIRSITIFAGNQAPTALINQPASGYLYTPGSSITVSGSANDPETGTLTGTALAWRVILHHNVHIHILETHTGSSFTMVAPDHADPDVYTEIELTATDPAGISTKKSINIYLNNGAQVAGNRISNPSFEDADPLNPAMPAKWIKGWYGVIDPVFTYPSEGSGGVQTRGAKLQVTSYTSGSAKWFFEPLFVSGNTEFRFENSYLSTVPSTVIAQFGFADGTYAYATLANPPPSATWQRTTSTFTTPLNTRTITIFHEISSVGTLSVDDYSLVSTASIPPPPPPQADTTKPTVAIVSPAGGTTVAGTISITASSSDNVGVSGVAFYIDGIQTGSEDTTAPYASTWNTASSTNGAHALTAVSRDAAGNTQTSAVVSVTVGNAVQGNNLVLNPSVETASATTINTPTSWRKGSFGINNAVFTYPVAGFDGAKGIRVSMTTYTNGDAKWYPNEIPVTAGKTYTFSNAYQSNVSTSLVIRYTSTTGAWSYASLAGTIPATPTWKQTSYNFTVPANIKSVTIFHVLNAVGSLSTDLYSVSTPGEVPPPPLDTVAPTTSVTSPTTGEVVSGTKLFQSTASDNVGVASVRFAIDGKNVGAEMTATPYTQSIDTSTFANGTHAVVSVARDTAGNIATSSSISFSVSNTNTPPPTGANLIVNGNMETAGAPGKPSSWDTSRWGTNVASFTYPIVGRDGGKAVSLTTTQYTDGDMKWYPRDVAMTQGRIYTFSDYYRSSTISDVIGRYTMTDGSNIYFGVKKENPPSGAWTQISASFIPPAGAVSVTFFHLISALGTLDVDDMSLVVSGTGTSTNDITPPTVAIVTPLQNATVSGNATFTASSSDNVGVDHVWYAVNGNPVSGNILVSPYTFVWNSTTVPNGTHVLKATTNDASGNNNTATTTIVVNNTGTPPPPPPPPQADTTKPTVAIVSPAGGTTVAGTISITASSSDNVGVSGVAFYIDGIQTGSENTTAPYSATWNTASTTNGTHALTGVARDVAGNTQTSAVVSVTVSNGATTPPPPPPPPPPATSGNLIANPSMEAAGAPGIPLDWQKSSWGSNNAEFIYASSSASDGVRFGQVTLTNYVSGDAKWFFKDVPVSAGQQYVFSDFYMSTVDTPLVARYTTVAGALIYVDIGTALASPTWKSFTRNITIPPNVVSVTIFHSITANGTLSVDNYSLTGSAGDAFTTGLVSLTFDDGWLSQYDTVLPILRTANMRGTFGVVSLETLGALPDNRIANPSLETRDVANLPVDWSRGGWGTNNAVFTYPSTGRTGVGANITITNYTDGDAKWFFKDATVLDAEKYRFTNYYQSDVATVLTARYTMNDGSLMYANLGTAPASVGFAQFTKEITIPVNTRSVTIFHSLVSAGSLTIDDASLERVQIYIDPAKVREIAAAGNEIASHTRTHVSLIGVTASELNNQLALSKSEILGMGVTSVNTFIYPYGDYNATTQQAVASNGYIGARTTDPGFNNRASDKFALKNQQVDVNTTVAQVKAWIDTAEATKTWVILMFHQVDSSGRPLAVTPANFQEIVNYLNSRSTIRVLTMEQGIGQMY